MPRSCCSALTWSKIHFFKNYFSLKMILPFTTTIFNSIYFFRWGTHLYMSLFPLVRLSICPSRTMNHVVRNSIAYDYDFWHTILKWWYFQVLFSFFLNFDFLGCYGGKRTKNSPKWKITITSVTCHISRTV